MQKFSPDSPHTSPDLYTASHKASHKAHLRNYSTSFKLTLALTLTASQEIIINKAGSQTAITWDIQLRLDQNSHPVCLLFIINNNAFCQIDFSVSFRKVVTSPISLLNYFFLHFASAPFPNDMSQKFKCIL